MSPTKKPKNKRTVIQQINKGRTWLDVAAIVGGAAAEEGGWIRR